MATNTLTGTYGITDFSRTPVSYTGDDGNVYNISVRTYEKNIAALGLQTALTGAEPGFKGKPRHVWVRGIDGNGHLHRRKLVYNKSVVLTAVTSAAIGTIDGCTNWEVGGHVGERTRA